MPQSGLHLLNFSALSLLVAVYWLPSSSGSFLFVNEPRSWEDANSYCREKYSHLAVPENMTEMNRLQQILQTTVKYKGDVWIGLKGGAQQQWLWSGSGNGTLRYKNWQQLKPNGNGYCTENDAKGWFDNPCRIKSWFMCYDEKRSPKYMLVQFVAPWFQAQNYCRQHYTDMASIESAEDQQLFLNITGDIPIWIGLFKDTWYWVNGEKSSFRYWGSLGEMEWTSNNDDCAAMRTTDVGRWYRNMCNVTLPFVCQKSIKQQTLRLVVSSKGDLNDPKIKAAILEQVHAKLKEQGISADAKLQWIERGDGIVFASNNSKV